MRRHKLVIVDDNEPLVSVVVEFFEMQGYEAVGLVGISHLDELAKLAPDLVVLDWNMPKLSGHEIVDGMRKSEVLGSVPVIVVSAKLKDREQIAGVNTVLSKPFQLTDLMQVVTALLNSEG